MGIPKWGGDLGDPIPISCDAFVGTTPSVLRSNSFTGCREGGGVGWSFVVSKSSRSSPKHLGMPWVMGAAGPQQAASLLGAEMGTFLVRAA